MEERPIRLAAVSYLNTHPLIDSVESGEIPGFEVVRDLPSRLPALVESGSADLGLLPCGYCVRHPELTLMEGAGIACRGPVRSILLLTRGDIRGCRHIAVTTSSMSSVKLLDLLLRRAFENDAVLIPSDDPVRKLRSGEVDGALLIGDPALQVESGSFRAYDLGEEWFRLTGLPFVFALWAGRDPELVRRAQPGLVEAMRRGRSAIPRIAAEAGPRLGLSADLCEEYLSHFIIHDVGESEMQGYHRFREMVLESDAAAAGGDKL